jgi:uncharacterized membrane protein
MLLGGVALLTGLALLPPFVPEALRSALMDAFAAVCHQLPSRSPHLGGVALAVCDRCLGIYGGLVLGGAASVLYRHGLARKGRVGRWTVAIALGVLALDWGGAVSGVWSNTPLTRAASGLLAGSAVGGFIWTRLTTAERSGLSVQESSA